MQAWTHRRKVKEVQARLLGMLHSLAKEVQSRRGAAPRQPLQKSRALATQWDPVLSGVLK